MRGGSTSLGALRRALEAAEEAGAETELDRLGKLVVEMAEGLNSENRRAEAVGIAV